MSEVYGKYFKIWKDDSCQVAYHLNLLGFYPKIWQVCKLLRNLLTLAGVSTNISAHKAATICKCTVKKLLTLAGLRTVFGVAGPNVTNLLALSGLWTLYFSYWIFYITFFGTPSIEVF